MAPNSKSLFSRIFNWTLLKALFFAAAFFALIWVLNQRWGSAPAMGQFLSPYRGVWIHRHSPADSEQPGAYSLRGLKGTVQILVDTHQVKHVFADNDEDLYFAQGWLVASERLWEMEFTVRVASGRLAEVMGRRALEVDRFFSKIGLPEAARQSAELVLNDPLTGPAVRAYTEGVNAYIRSIKDPRDLPFEYKLFETRPELWKPENATLLQKFMAYSLSAISRDLALTRSRARLSPADFEELFSLNEDLGETIVPRGIKWPFHVPSERHPEKSFAPDMRKLEPLPQPNPNNGSNEWAVTGKKSTTGRPILSNDIHLEYSLPSRWYEIQLVSPNQNVYGVTLPGAPGVILGFTPSLAWAVTNGGTDVMDWYELRYRDEKKSEYLYDGTWRPVISRELQIKVRGEPTQPLVVRQTHFGPIVYDESETPFFQFVPKGLAMRWAALDPSNELRSFLLLNRAKTVAECRAALETYLTPAQNFLCADNAGETGLWHMGRLPIRWAGQGRMVSDGSSSEWDWHGWIPKERIPFYRNPERGYLSSANQSPADETYPYYLGLPVRDAYRGQRINELLKEKPKFSPQDFVQMQLDTLSIPARTVLPTLLKAIASDAGVLDAEAKRAFELIAKWNYRFDEKSSAAVIFDTWYAMLADRIWRPHFPNPDEYQYPSTLKMIALITQSPASKWFDNPDTPEHETLHEQALASFKDAVVAIGAKLGHDPERWTWGEFRPTRFQSDSHIPGLGSGEFPAAGATNTIFANQGIHGPVWKLVVALGPKPQAWGMYPGGQSGDPFSRHYDDTMDDWRAGRMKELAFLKSVDEPAARAMIRLQLTTDSARKTGSSK